jgi:NAD(P)-dependent dehydrogenase (short-subunit alcohol dehydrogenase family)
LSRLGQGTIVACCREPDEAYNLNEFISSLDSKSKRRVLVLQLDLQYKSSIKSAGRQIRDHFQRVDMLLNVADLLDRGRTRRGTEIWLADSDREWIEKSIAVHYFAPVLFTKELFPLIRQTRKAVTTNQRPRAVVVNLAARVSSLADNEEGVLYSFRVRKLALNQATETLAHELRHHSAWVVALLPGRENLALSKPFQYMINEGPSFPVDLAVTKLLNVIDSLQYANSGGFYDWSGRTVSV